MDTFPVFPATQPLGEHMGLEINGADANVIGEDIPLDAVTSLLYDAQLLCFRDQTMTPDDLMRFTRLFGEPLPHVLTQFSLPDNPDIYVLSNIVENGKPLGNAREGFGWHTDLTYMKVPPSVTILYALEVPEEGGETWFASLYKAWDTLDETVKNRLRGLHTQHSYAHLYGQRVGVEPLTEEQKALTPVVTQPAVRIHPVTGREGMYLNTGDLVGIVEQDGDAQDETIALIGQLYDETIARFSYHHKWRPGDLLVWDNRGALHTATDYDTTRYRRLVWRTSVIGEVPIGWGEG
jgi:taurine dioxygenase